VLRYLTLDDVVEIHDRIIARTRDLPGFMDGNYGRGRIDAAVNRPQWQYYKHLFMKAAALMDSLANNHGFLSGNKRTALIATDSFLRINGYYLNIETEEAHAFITGSMARGVFNLDTISGWILAVREKR
jgi:death-on-curing protein